MKEDISRRDLVRGLGRFVCAGMLLGLVGVLGEKSFRRGRIFRTDGGESVCLQCAALRSCSLPQAVETRTMRAEVLNAQLARRGGGPDADIVCPFVQAELS